MVMLAEAMIRSFAPVSAISLEAVRRAFGLFNTRKAVHPDCQKHVANQDHGNSLRTKGFCRVSLPYLGTERQSVDSSLDKCRRSMTLKCRCGPVGELVKGEARPSLQSQPPIGR